MSAPIAAVAASAASAPPPTATTGAVTAVKPTTVTVTGTVNPNGLPTTWYFQYGPATDPGYGSTTPVKTAGTGKADITVDVALTGLASATSYHYRLVATSSAGTTDGADGVFNTSAAPAVVTSAAEKVTAASAQLDATLNPEALPATWYFQYGTTTSYGSRTASTALAAGPNPVAVSVPVDALAPHTIYHFRVVASSSAGTSYGADLSFTTDLSVSLNATSAPVVYGNFVSLSGVVASGRSGVPVTIMSERFDGSSFSGIAQVMTGSGGSWSYSTQPSARTTYEAYAGGGTSSPIVVSVTPAVFLTVNKNGTLSTRVVGSIPFAGHVLQLQRLSHGLWVTWKHVRLGSNGRVTFSTALPRGKTLVRMAIGPFVPGIDQAAPGYLAGYSKPATYVAR